MNRQAGIAWLMILLQAAMFWYMSETILFPILIVLISTPAVWWRRRWDISSGYLPGIDLVLAAGCALRWNLAPYEPPTMTSFLNYPLVHAAGQFFLLAQVARLWARRPGHTLPVYLPLLAVLVFVCLGDVQLSRYGRMRRMHQRATFALVGLSCAFYAMARRHQDPPSKTARWVRPAASAAVLVTCGLTANAGNSWLMEQWSELEALLLNPKNQQRANRQNLMVGFSGQAPLGSMQLLQSTLSDEIAVRVISDRPPGYLRGAVFERYTSHGWEMHSDWIPLNRSRRPLSAVTTQNSIRRAPRAVPSEFLLRQALESRLRPMTFWRSAAMDRFTFLPLSMSRLEATTDLLSFDRHTVVSADNLPNDFPLTAWVPESSESLAAEPIVQPTMWEFGSPLELKRLEVLAAKVRLRQLPERLEKNSRLRQLATSIFAECETPHDKIAAVQRHFANSPYSTHIEIPPMVDPVLYFLLERPAAHCEFFASATAVLLRMAGIPCRYVTGYAGADFSVMGNYWVVKQQNAHAWVEAFLPDEGWVIVDSTPAGHAPDTATSFHFWQIWDELTLRGQMIRTFIASEGWSGKWAALKLFLMTLLSTIPGVVLTGGLVFLAVRKLKSNRKSITKRPHEPELMELQHLLGKLDRRLQRLKLKREDHETLHQFSKRLQTLASSHPSLDTAANWYLRYAESRYGSSSLTDVQDTLSNELNRVLSLLREQLRSGR